MKKAKHFRFSINDTVGPAKRYYIIFLKMLIEQNIDSEIFNTQCKQMMQYKSVYCLRDNVYRYSKGLKDSY